MKETINLLVEYLQPELTPYETTAYLFLLYNTHIKDGVSEFEIGGRTIAKRYGKGTRGKRTNMEHINKVMRSLEKKGCIKILNKSTSGTLYHVYLPMDIQLVKEKMENKDILVPEQDYYSDPQKRIELYERDNWICQYCGEKLNSDSVTIDRYIPESKGGKNNKDNLRTCCFMCNSIKSGKDYDEAIPHLLKSIQERRAKSHE